jgi:hypothetical protein
MASLHGSRLIQILMGLMLLSLLVGIFYVGATLPPSESVRVAEEAPATVPPREYARICEVPQVLESTSPLGARLQEVCAAAKEMADQIEIATIPVPIVGVSFWAFVVARHSRCEAEGLSLLLLMEPAGKQRREPVLSARGFFQRWIEELETRDADAIPAATTHQLIAAWDHGQDSDGKSLVSLESAWAYSALDGGVREVPLLSKRVLPLDEVWDLPRSLPAFSGTGVWFVGRHRREPVRQRGQSPEERAAWHALIRLIEENPQRFVH